MFDHEDKELLKELILVMATLDETVQAATTVINDLVAALAAAASPVPDADLTALEAAVTAGQAALPATPTEPPAGTTSDNPVPTVEAPVNVTAPDPATPPAAVPSVAV